MKSVFSNSILAIFALMTISVSICQGNKVVPVPATVLLSGINATVNAILASQDLTGANTSVYIWDLIPIQIRTALVIQLPVTSIWNVTNATASGASDLTWATLPANVQSLLNSEKQSHAFFTLTFAQWGVVDPSDIFANYSLSTFASAACTANLPNITALTDQVNFNTQVNLTKLVQSFTSKTLLSYINYDYNSWGFRNLLIEYTYINSHSQIASYLARQAANILQLFQRNRRPAPVPLICYLSQPLNAMIAAAERCFVRPDGLKLFGC